MVTTLDQKNGGRFNRLSWKNVGIRVRYMHHDVDTVERMEIIRDLAFGRI